MGFEVGTILFFRTLSSHAFWREMIVESEVSILVKGLCGSYPGSTTGDNEVQSLPVFWSLPYWSTDSDTLLSRLSQILCDQFASLTNVLLLNQCAWIVLMS